MPPNTGIPPLSNGRSQFSAINSDAGRITAVASFSSASVLNSLNLQFGQTVQIWEEYWSNERTVTWLRGCLFNNKEKKGIFPAAYIVSKECSVENEGPSEVVAPLEDAIIKEVTFVLREWHEQLKSLFKYRKSIFQTILLVMGELYKFHGTLLSNTLTKEHAEEMKHQIVTMIDWVNGQLGMDLVPRVNYQQADPDNVSVVEMYRIHERSVKNCQGAYTSNIFDISIEGSKSHNQPGGVLKVNDGEKQGEAIHHLLVSLCSFACSVGDNSEVLLSLYDSKESKYISEKFVMYFTKDGQREGSDKNNSTIFTDLNSEEVRKDLYLVVHILRKGRLTTEGSIKKMAHFNYRRPWGVSVLCLRELFQSDSEQEFFLRVQCLENESFFNAHENLIKKQIQLIGKTPSTNKQNQGVTLSLTFLHGDMKNVKVENPILFSRGVVLTQRIGFPDFITPGEIRNDLYLTMHGAELDRGSKTASKNVEVRVTVYNDKYELIKDCIFPASGETMKPNFLSYVLYHNNSPKWNETIRLSIPIEKFSTSHIRLELCHCSNRDKSEKKMIGFSYLSVTTKENTTRMDGRYDLRIYKCEDFSKVKNYLAHPSLRDSLSDTKNAHSSNNIPYPQSNREFITVETLLCSSKFAQKAELLSVLQWESSTNMDKTIPRSLDNLLKLKGQELVPYLQDILDALFNMFIAGERQPVTFASNIFETLVCIFNLLHQQMFEKFSIVLEDYLEKSFSSPLAHKEIMHCLKVQAEQVYTCTDFDERSSKRVFKVLEDIFKFSVKSCMLSKRIYGGQSEKHFRENLNKIFEAFGKVVSSNEKELNKVQAQLLNHLHKVYTPLLLIISNVDLAALVVFILNKVNQDQGLTVIKAKTNLIKNTINSQLFLDSTSRNMLLPLILDHLKTCLLKQHHLELMANTLGDLLTTVYKLKEVSDIKDEVSKIIQGVFDVLIRTLGSLSENRMKMAGSLLVACLTEMLRLMDVSHYQKLMSDAPKPKSSRVRLSTVVMPQIPVAASKDFLNRVLMVFRNLVKADDLPADWTTMRMITSSVMLTSIQYIAEDLTVNFLNGSDFDRELWHNFFLLAVDFITQSALQLEQYSEAKSRQIKNQYNDMRIPIGCHIYSLWIQLGQNKQHLILELIGPFLRSTMVPQLELRKITIPIFFDIMQCEYQLMHHLRRVEDLMIQELDSLVLEHHGDVGYMKLFQSILLDKIQKDNPEMQDEGKRFVSSITVLLERLLDYRVIMDREEQRDTKMHCTFNILNFYKDSRRDMYIRYIFRLHELHYSACNFVEAGLTLQLYADLLSWSQAVLQAEISFQTQTEAARKEDLFSRVMDCFDKGKAWEYGIPLCKELAEHYEKTFQYAKLGKILQKHAYFLYQILEGNKLRQNPTYYRVAYFGKTFPPYLKNKAFIYRGDECLKLATIMSQLMTEYPLATILSTNSPLEESCKQGDAQYIQIVNVNPIPSERPEFADKEVPIEISCFYKMNEVDTFQFDRPYWRGRKDEKNEFKSLCLERTIMQTSYKLPGILRWYEVNSTQVVHLKPVQTATTTVKQMNAELKSSSRNALADPDNCLQHLEMRLQGVISGAVNGGIPKYQEAFFNKEYTAEFPDEAPYIEELKSVILEQIELLEHGMAIHGKFASIEMIPLHRSMADMFIKMRSSMGYKNTTLNHHLSNVSVGSESINSDTSSSPSQNSRRSIRSSLASNDVGYQDDESIEAKEKRAHLESKLVFGVPVAYDPLNIMCLLPTCVHTPEVSHTSRVSLTSPEPSNTTQPASSKPPPLPVRKMSQPLIPISEQKQEPTASVYRSDSTRSTDSRGADLPVLPETDASSSVSLNDEAHQGLYPKRKPSMSSLLQSFGGSSPSISSTGHGAQKFDTPSGNNSNSMNQLSSNSPDPSPASPLATPPPLIPRTPSNRETVARAPQILHSETGSQSSSCVSSNRETTPRIPTSNSGSTVKRLSSQFLNKETVVAKHNLYRETAAHPPNQNRETAANPPNPNRETAAHPPNPNRETAAHPPNQNRETAANPPNPNRETAAHPPNPNRETAAHPPNQNRETAANPPNPNRETAAHPPNPNRETAAHPPNPNRETAANPPNSNGETPRQPPNPPPSQNSPARLEPRPLAKSSPPLPPLFFQSNMTLAVTPPRPPSNATNRPPPVPERKPSVSSS